MWIIAKKIGAMLKSHYKALALLYAFQDGIDAGQTVAHVHMHIIPRTTLLDAKKQIIDDEDRKPRTIEERHAEALMYRKLLETSAK
jgi:bis(5'-adenosyl)-triphosphatase